MKNLEDIAKDPDNADKIINPGQKFAYRITHVIFSESILVYVGGIYALVSPNNGLAFKERIIEHDSKQGITVSQFAEIVGPEELPDFRLM